MWNDERIVPLETPSVGVVLAYPLHLHLNPTNAHTFQINLQRRISQARTNLLFALYFLAICHFAFTTRILLNIFHNFQAATIV
jgi:hypothetical protein